MELLRREKVGGGWRAIRLPGCRVAVPEVRRVSRFIVRARPGLSIRFGSELSQGDLIRVAPGEVYRPVSVRPLPGRVWIVGGWRMSRWADPGFDPYV